MRVGLIAPPWIPVPPPTYGGTELVVDGLARGLRDLGVVVELFTVGTSTCPVPRRYLYPEPVEPLGEGLLEVAHVLAAYDALADVDIVHDHTQLGALVGASRRGGHPPIVTTNHNPFTPAARRILAAAACDDASVVAISQDQARSAGDVPVTAVIPHGLDLDAYRPGPGDGGFLLFVGRMCPTKGVHRAVRIAAAAGLPLEIVTKMRSAEERAYYEQEVRPLLDGQDEPADRTREERLELFRNARALLNPIAWPEPFGLVMIEALASGTPVVSFAEGAAPEIVENGRTGFLVADEEEAVAAVRRVDQISREDCRAAAEARFSVARMAEDHLRLYERVLDNPRSRVARAADGPVDVGQSPIVAQRPR